MGAEIYQRLKILLKHKGLSTAVGDEGGFAPDLESAEQVLEFLTEAIEDAGYTPGSDVVFAIDVAASELYDEDREGTIFPGRAGCTPRDTDTMADAALSPQHGLLQETRQVSHLLPGCFYCRFRLPWISSWSI